MTERTSANVYAVEPASRRRLVSIPAAFTRPRRIGLLEHCGTGNLGDDATVTTVLQQIKSRWPTASIVGLSLDPADSERRHGIPCFAIRQSVFPFEREWSPTSPPAESGRYLDRLKTALKRTGPVFRAAKAIKSTAIVGPFRFVRETIFLGHALFLSFELDVIIICGGGQLLDWGGPWAFPYTLFKWIILAKWGRAKCIFLNNGAGPLDAPLSRWFIKRGLSMADYVSLRDLASAELIRKIGFQGKVKVVADNAWGLQLPNVIARPRPGPKSERVIGIAPMAYGDSSRHWVDDHPGYLRLIDNLAKFSGEMLGRGHRIKLFSSDIWFDAQALADLEAAIRKQYPTAVDRVTREPVTGVGDLLTALSAVDCYVTCRFHGVVFASLLNVPSIALAPHPKVTTLMDDMGLTRYCVDISELDATDLAARFDHLDANIDDVKARIRRHVAHFQALLTSQFDCLFATNVQMRSKDEQVLSIRSER
jgi:polysaccharide pyruvyl transferase WcaK-like protein